MSIYGVSGYGTNDYQNVLSMVRLSGIRNAASYEAVPPVKSVSPAGSRSSAYSDTIKYLKDYQSELIKLESAASKLKETSRGNVFEDYEAASTEKAVAEAEGTYRIKEGTDINLEVHALAQAQKNVSASHDSQETVDQDADMMFEVLSSTGSVKVSVNSLKEDGSAKTYNQMYQEAASAINEDSRTGVKAFVTNVEGKVSLVLTSRNTGETNGFTVKGKTGAAEGLTTASTEAQDAVYTVTQNGNVRTMRSDSNQISLDYGRIEAELKGSGSTRIYSGIDLDKVTSAVDSLVESYNSVKGLLKENEGRGTGSAAHSSSFKRGMADVKTLNAIGITYNRDGDLEVDKEKLTSALETDYEGTKSLIAGQFGISEKAAQKADAALSDPVQRIVNNDLTAASRNEDFNSSSLQYFSSFVRSGPYNLGNYYSVGLMLNSWA